MRPGPNHTRKAIPLLAALSLVLHPLLPGIAALSRPMLPMAAAAAEFDCIEHAASHGQSDHGHKDRDHRICCILCSKIGSAFGPLPVGSLLQIPLRTVVAADLIQRGLHPHEARSVLPVGARAPPLLG